MRKDTKNNITDYPTTIEDLMEEMQDPSGRYKHLQFVFDSKIKVRYGFGEKYLIVNKNGYGVYIFEDINYHDGIIQMIFTIPSEDYPAVINLDINNKNPQYFLINWNDIKEKVSSEKTFTNSDDLLELEND